MAKKKILIVEDEAIVARDIQMTLSRMGYDVAGIVAFGEDAVEKAGELAPDLVLMDIMLAGAMDGIQAASRIHERFNIPIIYVTAFADEKILERAKLTQPYGYIIKPFEKSDLKIAIEIALYRSRMENKLIENREWLSVTLRSIGDAVISTDKNNKIMFMNPIAEQMTGWKENEAKGNKLGKVFKLVTRKTGKIVKYPAVRIMRGDMVVRLGSNPVLITKEGRKIPISYSGAPIKDRKEKILGVVLVFRDITERRKEEREKGKTLGELKRTHKSLEKTQEQLFHAEKMAGLGQLSAGIAHEFNNLLGIMSGYVQLARRTRTTEDMLEALSVVSSTTERASKIIKNLMFFSAKKALRVDLHDIRLVVDRVLTLVESQLEKKNIKIIKRYEEIKPIKFNVVDIQQVFLNIIVNARDSMTEHGGLLTIGIKKEEKYIAISFKDTGKGINEKLKRKVFDPFFTTKGALGGSEIPGTGLGLSISYSITKRHRGTIELESKEGEGATFTVKLPVKMEGKAEVAEKRKKTRTKRKKKQLNILVVDDEEEICRMLIKYLSLEKHKVQAVNSGEKAMHAIKKEKFDTVLLDILMPGTGGIPVLQAIKKMSPKPRVILMSGNIEDPKFKKHVKEEGAFDYIEKPFKMEEVLNIINSI